MDQTIDIPLKPVKSSQIHAIGYDAGSQTLRVQFNVRLSRRAGGRPRELREGR